MALLPMLRSPMAQAFYLNPGYINPLYANGGLRFAWLVRQAAFMPWIFPQIGGNAPRTRPTPNTTLTIGVRWGKSRGLLTLAFPPAVSALAPTVASTAPNNGPAAGGTTTIITGANFIGASAVTFGGVSVTSFVVLSSTQIQVVTQPHAAGAVDVAVTTPTGGTGTGVGVYTYT